MGQQHLGTPLPWDEARKYADHVREHGISQFLHLWDRVKDRHGDEFLFGDEIEYMVIVLDDETKKAKLSLRQTEILTDLAGTVANIKAVSSPDSFPTPPNFYAEYMGYMLESTPGSPYTGSIQDLLAVESNMRFRRLLAKKHLRGKETLLTLSSFPRLGAPGVFTDPYFSPDDAKSTHSLFLPEEIIGAHPRFTTMAANVRQRRGCKVNINLPIFIDERTSKPFVDPTIPWQRSLYPEDAEARCGAALMDHIYMDATCFGAGCCGVHLTFQSCNADESRRIYDALIQMAPIMLALTAASPIWRGYLSDVDSRWNALSGGFDDRTAEEIGRVPLKENKYIIPKSRWDSNELYISTDWSNKPAYNDVDVPYNQKLYTRLVQHGIDQSLAKHVAYAFIRDPLVIFSESINQNDETSNDHFENLQSTNWNTVRFKPPLPNSTLGWRVELRSMEPQPTDFENAAFIVFVILLSRAILAFDLNFYIPISKVNENMSRAQKRDAVRHDKFIFRKNVLPPGHVSPTLTTPSSSGSCSPVEGHGDPPKERKLRNGFPRAPPPPMFVATPVEDEYEEMSMREIFEGKGPAFPGLIGLVEAYLDTLDMDPSERQQINAYVDLVRCRANGSLLTMASWMRRFVRSHPLYKFDSVVSEEINYDLMVAIDEIERGILHVPELLPRDYARSQVNGLYGSRYGL